ARMDQPQSARRRTGRRRTATLAMRILMIVPKHPFPVAGGLERQAHELAKALVRKGHAVHVLSTRFAPGQETLERIDGVLVHRVNWVGPKAARFLLLTPLLALSILRLRRQIDLVHVHCISSFGTFVALLSKAMGLPVVTKLPGAGPAGIPGIRCGPLGLLRLTSLRRSDVVVALAPESLDELSEISYPAGRILKVTNGVHLAPRRAHQSAPSSPVNVVFVGRFSKEKGLPVLLNAWRVVKTRVRRPVKLYLIGDGQQKLALHAMAGGLGLGDTVEFCGYRADVAAELAAADVFVLPSYGEGNSNAILEAMAAGLPIVSTKVGGTPIQVGKEGEKFLVPPGDPTVLADRLVDVIEDDAERIRLGAAMHARVKTYFAIDHVAHVYEQAYGLILSGRRDQVGRLSPTFLGERSH
ncbi:MAG: glycosyltransferase family 4 protein, partial [Candidatus Dormibacteraceae bacterium]